MPKRKQPIAQNRPTHRASKLIAMKRARLGARQIEILPRIERGIADKIESLSVQPIAPALRHHAHNAARIRPLRRKKEPLVNLELIDRRHR